MDDTLFGMFKSSGFWKIIIIGSFIGAAISLLISALEKDPVIIGYSYICPENKNFKRAIPIIRNIEDSVGNYDYQNLMIGSSNRARFDGFVLSIGKRVPLLVNDTSSKMTKVYDTQNEEEGWVRTKDLKTEPCD